MADEKFADLVFEGGGVKGIGLAGAFAALEQRGFTHKGVAGTSAGAITAALIAAGYSSVELDEILLNIPFADFKDKGWEDRVPLIGRGASLLFERGIYEGQFFERWMTELLEAKKVTKFGQLVDEEAEEAKNRYRLRVIASDVTHRRMLVLPNDADHLGVDPDDLDIAHAVRMSMSIPVFFEPVVHRNDRTGEEHLIVDGGMLSNFPVWLFDCEDRDPRWPTFGLKLVEPDPKKAIGHRLPGEEHGAKAGSLVDYFKSLASTMMEAHDRLYLENATFARTIPIPTLGVGTTEFDITPERVRAVYDSGHEAASDFLDQWDFAAYIEEFRRGKEHSRRAELDASKRSASSP
jgi:NTE family protein